MAVLLKNSVFYHIGRTGGYWVRDVLDKLGLVEGEVGSFHTPPKPVKLNKEVLARDFSFCFVRHPLTWLRSAWIHEEYNGWELSAFPEEARRNCFADFLEALLYAFPQGPVSHYFQDYLSCTYVGRQESLREDLCLALFKAREHFNSAIIYDHAVSNEGRTLTLSKLAVAPLPLLRRVMAAEEPFCIRFAYNEIPERMVSEKRLYTTDIYAPLVKTENSSVANVPEASQLDSLADASIMELREAFDIGERTLEVEKELARRLADYSFSRSLYLTKNLRIRGGSQRDTFDILDFISSQNLEHKSVIELGARDGMFCLFAEACGATNVVARDFTIHQGTEKVVSPFLRSSVKFVAGNLYETESEDFENYDFVFLFDILNMARYPFLLLRVALSMLKPGGQLLIATGAFSDIENLPLLLCPTPRQSPYSPTATSFFNVKGLTHTLEAIGFDEIVIRKCEAHGIAKHLPFNELRFPNVSVNEDGRYSPIVRLLLSARKNTELRHVTPFGEFDSRELLDRWDFGRPIFFANVMAGAAVGEIKQILKRSEDRANKLAAELEALKFALNDREQDLAYERAQLRIRGREVVQAREELERLRGQLKTLTDQSETPRNNITIKNPTG